MPPQIDFQKGSICKRENEKSSILLFSKEEEEALFFPMIRDTVGAVLLNVWPEVNECHL